jgi:segregation and condensation protein B
MKKKNNLKILKFPIKLSDVEKKVEAILFSAAEPLNLEAIKDKLQTKTK